MTVLQRTDLTTSQKIQCAAAAVAGQHAHGSKTALTHLYHREPRLGEDSPRFDRFSYVTY